jgi:site-specific DNA-methyltransferase (adenine-specific)
MIWKVELKDAQEGIKELGDKSVDCIVTDPAYASLEKWRAVGTTTRLKVSKSSSNKWFPVVPNSYYVPFLEECLRVLKQNTYMFVMCDEITSHVIYASMREVGIKEDRIGFAYWRKIGKPEGPPCEECGHQPHKPGTPGMGYPFRSVIEKIVFAKKGKPGLPKDKSVRNDLGQYWIEEPMLKGDYYPTQKPHQLIQVLLRQAELLPGSMILDPFAGSGSTGYASYLEGHQFLGFDVKQEALNYFEKWKKTWKDRPGPVKSSSDDVSPSILDMFQ